MHIETDIKLDFQDVLIKPKRSKLASRAEVKLEREFQFKNSSQSWKGIPICASNMSTIGTTEMAKALGKCGLLTALHKHYSCDDIYEFMKTYPEMEDRVFITIGANDNDYAKLGELRKKMNKLGMFRFPKMLMVDVANGYQESFVDFIKKVREEYHWSILFAGNVATPEMTEQLIISGADGCKIGIGCGSVCTTRLVTGVGVPQLSAVIECADAAHGIGGKIMADGGMTCVADMVKSFGSGSDFIMIGSFLAGTNECDGEWVEVAGEEKSHMKHFGMSSEEAMNKFNGGMAKYRAAEGRSVLVEPKGPVEGVVQEILGGIRSACTYTGCNKLKDLSKCTTFIKVNRTHNRIFDR